MVGIFIAVVTGPFLSLLHLPLVLIFDGCHRHYYQSLLFVVLGSAVVSIVSAGVIVLTIAGISTIAVTHILFVAAEKKVEEWLNSDLAEEGPSRPISVGGVPNKVH